MRRILVTGATGQIGSELVPALRQKYGNGNVFAAGHKKIPGKNFSEEGPFLFLDVKERELIEKIVNENKIDTIFHLAAMLSAVSEKNPQEAWDINMGGLINVLEACRKYRCSLFFPSSIGAFGPLTPKDNTPQNTIQRPDTMYGICKVSGELLCDYYFNRFGVDTRGVRYPGLISFKTPPGGGTTDYAVEIFYSAIKDKKYVCYLKEDTRLDMMYMPDATRAAIEIMEADPKRLNFRNAYNIAAMSFTPKQLADEIQKIIPGFVTDYKIDSMKQKIADSWPHKMDDCPARTDWDWKPKFDLQMMTKDMLENLSVMFK